MIGIFTYIIPIWIYAFVEIHFGVRYKTKPTDKETDLTYFAVTIPAISILFVPIIMTAIFKYKPTGLSVTAYLVLFIIGLFIRYFGLKELKSLFSQKVETRTNHYVVDTGVYKYVRHPSYLGTLIMSFGVLFYYVNIYSIILMVMIVIGITARIKKEEAYLRKNLEGYADYMKKTKKILPGIY